MARAGQVRIRYLAAALALAACAESSPATPAEWDALASAVAIRSLAAEPGGFMRSPKPVVLCVMPIGAGPARPMDRALLTAALERTGEPLAPIRSPRDCHLGSEPYDPPMREQGTGRPA